MVRTTAADEVDTRRTVTLRPRSNKWLLLGAALQILGQVLVLVSGLLAGDLGHHAFSVVLGLVAAAFWVPWWFLIWVRVQPAGLVIRYGFTRRTVEWDEIATVRLTTKRAWSGLVFYGPMLELHSGEELLVRGLLSPTTTRRLPRSVPARQVEIIASYLRDHRSQQQEQPGRSC